MAAKKQLFIEFTAREETIRDDRGDGGPYSGYRESETHLEVHGLHRKPVESFGESLDVDDAVYRSSEGWLVVVRYKTGSTFGSQRGCYSFIAIFKNRAAAKTLADELEKDNAHSKKFTFLPKTKNPAYDEIHCSWKGYFERMEYVDVIGLGIE
jgi:hypothetical protein